MVVVVGVDQGCLRERNCESNSLRKGGDVVASRPRWELGMALHLLKEIGIDRFKARYRSRVMIFNDFQSCGQSSPMPLLIALLVLQRSLAVAKSSCPFKTAQMALRGNVAIQSLKSNQRKAA